MQRVSATVIYKDGMIYNLTVNHKGTQIPLIRYDLRGVKPYKHPDFDSMYVTVLQFIKMSNFYCSHVKQFGAKWYDIMWIDLDNPTMINKYGLTKEK